MARQQWRREIMIRLDIPGFGPLEIRRMVSDYTGTQASGGVIRKAVRTRLIRLSGLVEIHMLTSDTFGTSRRELADIPVTLHVLSGDQHDEQKQSYVRALEPQHVAAFGNGNNDRWLLKTVKEAGGLAIAVDNGEGCALDAIFNANLFVFGSENALDLLLDPNRCKATLRF
jgi:soluble P-type ATPase